MADFRFTGDVRLHHQMRKPLPSTGKARIVDAVPPTHQQASLPNTLAGCARTKRARIRCGRRAGGSEARSVLLYWRGSFGPGDPERTSSSERGRCRRSVQRVPSPMPIQGAPMTDRDKILIALGEKPLKVFEIMKRVNIKHEDDCQSLLLKMRDDGAVKFDIHKGYWLAV